MSVEWKSIRLSGATQGIVIKTVHKNLRGVAGVRGGEVVGGGGGQVGSGGRGCGGGQGLGIRAGGRLGSRGWLGWSIGVVGCRGWVFWVTLDRPVAKTGWFYNSINDEGNL